jgi:hypothetical protein
VLLVPHPPPARGIRAAGGRSLVRAARRGRWPQRGRVFAPRDPGGEARRDQRLAYSRLSPWTPSPLSTATSARGGEGRHHALRWKFPPSPPLDSPSPSLLARRWWPAALRLAARPRAVPIAHRHLTPGMPASPGGAEGRKGRWWRNRALAARSRSRSSGVIRRPVCPRPTSVEATAATTSWPSCGGRVPKGGGVPPLPA